MPPSTFQQLVLHPLSCVPSPGQCIATSPVSPTTAGRKMVNASCIADPLRRSIQDDKQKPGGSTPPPPFPSRSLPQLRLVLLILGLDVRAEGLRDTTRMTFSSLRQAVLQKQSLFIEMTMLRCMIHAGTCGSTADAGRTPWHGAANS